MIHARLRAAAGNLSVEPEDFTTYTEVDPNGRIAVTSSKVTASGLRRDETAYTYHDKGQAAISGNFEISFEVSDLNTTTSSLMALVSLSNSIGSLDQQVYRITVDKFASSLRLLEVDSGSPVLDSYTFSGSGPFYCKLTRDTTAGANGTAYLGIASTEQNRDDGVFIDTLSVALQSDVDTRYLYAISSFNDGVTSAADGSVSNMTVIT